MTLAYRDADRAALLDTLNQMVSGRPRPELLLAWVLVMLEDDEVIDSKEIAHNFRCEETYVGWCCEVGVRRGALRHCRAPWRLAGVAAPLDAWAPAGLDPLARLVLEAAFDGPA